jgi:hypothetical protein
MDGIVDKVLAEIMYSNKTWTIGYLTGLSNYEILTDGEVRDLIRIYNIGKKGNMQIEAEERDHITKTL